jgi:acyl-CoA synthetase (AMP-forming)/AMP-acid ligase II
MYPGAIAARAPDRPAVIMGGTRSGGRSTVTYRELDERSNRLAHLFRARGIGRGGRIAIFLENHPRFLEVAWAAQRSGLGYTTVNSHPTTEEAAYIVNDCGATAIISSAQLAPVATTLTPELTPNVHTRLMIDGTAEHWESYEDATGAEPTTPIIEQRADVLVHEDLHCAQRRFLSRFGVANGAWEHPLRRQSSGWGATWRCARRGSRPPRASPRSRRASRGTCPTLGRPR